MMTARINPLIRMIDKLALHVAISFEDRIRLLELPYASRSYEAGSYLLREGDRPNHCGVLVSGFAYRHKVSTEGHRQIVSVHIPGEFYDLQQLHLATADNNVQALTPCEVVIISHDVLRQLETERPTVARAFYAMMMVELSIAREWMLNIGRRDARTRIAHLLCEFAFRLDRQGLPPGQAYELPMMQEQLGDALGLTSVHINRSIKMLVNDGLIGYSRRGITIPNWELLVEEAGFVSRYLHMNAPDATIQPSRYA